MTPGFLLSCSVRRLRPEARSRRFAAARQHLEPFEAEAAAPLAHRVFLARTRLEVYCVVLEHGEAAAERLLRRKWHRDRAAVGRGEHPLALPHVATPRQAIALAVRRRCRSKRPAQARREARPAARMVGCRSSTGTGPNSPPSPDGDDADGATAPYRTPARSPRDETTGPSRPQHTTAEEVRHASA